MARRRLTSFPVFIACHGAFAWRQFCDPEIDRKIRQAEALQLTDPKRAAKLWTRLDHDVVDRAIWLPLTTLRVVDFVSARVRHYQYSPVYFFLPAQAWIR